MEEVLHSEKSTTQIGSEFSSYQKTVIAILAFLQFTIVLDFMVLSPLGAVLMPALHLSPAQFGLVVSGYAFSAGISGIMAAGYADRFDRKKMLLFFYSGFILGTFLCAVAPNYEFLLGARIITGFFGGVVSSIVLAISTDLFPYHMRGRVMGVVQTAFSASQIMGLPIGLFLANHFGWHIPFVMIALVGSVVGMIIFFKLKPIDGHLKKPSDKNPLMHLLATVTRARYVHAFIATALMSTGGFMLMPFASAFAVNNVNIGLDKLPLVYMATGAFSILAAPVVGRLSDKIGKFRVFALGSALTIITVFIYSGLSITPIELFMIINILLFMGVSARMISSQALLSAVPDQTHRGSFMSINSSFQQISGGFAAVIAGAIVVQPEHGPLQHFDTLGHVVMGTTLITVVLMYTIHLRLNAESSQDESAEKTLSHDIAA